MHRIGWKVEKTESSYAFIKTFPLIGSVIKIQRPNKLPSITSLKNLKKKHRARSLIVEHDLAIQNLQPTTYNLQPNFYLPTKTIHINLKPSEREIFDSFSSSTRRAVRRAVKNNVVVKVSQDIDAFITLKKKHFFPLGFLFTREIEPLWKTFAPRYATLLLAYKNRFSEASNSSTSKTQLLAGILLLFHQQVSYYWLAASTKKGNKLRAPTLLVWKALKLAKKKDYKIFDFEGIYDERFPNQNKNWKGFTRFKNGFGGEEIYYPQPLAI